MALASSFDAKIWAEWRSVSATVKCVIAAGVRSNDWSLTPIKSVNSVSINLSMILKFISVFIWIQSIFNSGMTLPGLWSMQIESQKPRQRVINVDRKVLAKSESVACWPARSPEYLEIIRIIQKRSERSYELSDIGYLQMVCKVSGWSEKCLDDPEGLKIFPDDPKSLRIIGSYKNVFYVVNEYFAKRNIRFFLSLVMV